MFTLEDKLREATRAAAELRRRMTNRVYRGRLTQRNADRRLAIADSIIADYENAIDSRDTGTASSAFQPEGAVQYRLPLKRAPGHLYVAGNGNYDQESD